MASTTTPPSLISSEADLKEFLSSISSSSILYIDLEGNNLCRHGTISLITILLLPDNVIRLIDVTTLKILTFTVISNDGKSLKSIFEDASISKYIWDVRNDADALWALYHVGLAGVVDIQLLENATRVGSKKYVRGLDKCVQYDLKVGFMELNRWLRTKKETLTMMSTGVFSVRPLDAKTIQYCVNDVIHLPSLQDVYMKRIKTDWLEKVETESVARVAQAHAPGYDPHSSTKTHGPWGSGTTQGRLNVDDPFEYLEEQREEALADELFPYNDDVGYYDWDEDDRVNSADAAMDDTFDSCWDRGS
ncbi:3 -5 exonuclease [Ophiostoma piceae UAMH 11346]|uniref:3-5 exonuclease n=1 Tax=Ophiostoma piceae (strain UAMH 11346) TaxID=1262450 RepID=S3C7K9_OPHP1|nr:3 -5 exonuclease [Ophiostoma piceae UAMH 11346]